MALILDGGMGHELKLRGVKQPPGWEGWFIGGALANRDFPDVVRELHMEYFDAGADVATTNNFVVTQHTLDKVFGEHTMLEELTRAAAAVAAEARDACAARSGGRKLLVAGSLPPLRESYEPLSPAEIDDARRQYAAIASALSDTCDVLLCETMASAAEARCRCLNREQQGRAAAAAASAAGLPVWVSWTLEASPPPAAPPALEDLPPAAAALSQQDSTASKLRSGEPLSAALDAVRDIRGLAAALVNCSAPSAIGAAMPLLAIGAPPGVLVGGYGNGFRQTTSEWMERQARASGEEGGSTAASVPPAGGAHGGTDEFDGTGLMTADCYARHAEGWVKEGGASIVGGCCGIGPQHIRAISQRLSRGGSGGAQRTPP